MEITTYTGTGTDSRTADLPAPVTGRGSVKSDLMRIDRRFGTVVREGPWLVAGRIEVRLSAGDARLDFTEAVINVDTVYLDVDLGLGGELTLVVPPGVKVVAENLDLRLGDFDMRAPCDDATPVFLRIEVSGRLHPRPGATPPQGAPRSIVGVGTAGDGSKPVAPSTPPSHRDGHDRFRPPPRGL